MCERQPSLSLPLLQRQKQRECVGCGLENVNKMEIGKEWRGLKILPPQQRSTERADEARHKKWELSA